MFIFSSKKKKMFFLAFATVSIFNIKPTLECMSNKIGKKVNNLQVMKADISWRRG